MPKIIKNLNDKIIKACIKLFGKHGYENVEMKMIAKECGVAVGTLYNYYSSKWEIFSEVQELFWKGIIEHVKIIAESNATDETKFEELVRYLDDSLTVNVSLCEVFYNRNINEVDYKAINELKSSIISELSVFIGKLMKDNDLIKYKNSKEELANMLLILICSYRNVNGRSADVIISLFKSAL